MQPLSVQAESPQIQFKQSQRLIPSSQGLLATTHTGHTAAPSAPIVLPSDGAIQNDQAPLVTGLKLLCLQHPPLPHQSTTQSHQPSLKHNHKAAAQRAEEGQRNWSSAPRRQLNFNNPHGSQHQIQISEGSRRLPPALPAHTPAPTQGPYRLHHEPVSHGNITFPKLHFPPPSRPSTVITAPLGETPAIKLLHIDSAPKMASNGSYFEMLKLGDM